MAIDADLDLYYRFQVERTLNSAYGGGYGPTLSLTRSGTNATWFDNNGTLQTAGANEARFDHSLSGASRGLLIEQAATNSCLWNRDFTNAAWTKSNISAALDATGLDGSANSASTLTATLGNGTCTQSITLGSDEYVFSVYVKRVTGSGNIDITDNGGTNWTTLTGLSSTAWTRHEVVRTQANPDVGFRIVTGGDAIEVDYVQLEASGESTSPILTTTTADTRPKDVCTTSTVSWYDSTQATFAVRYMPRHVTSDSLREFISLSDTSFSDVMRFYANAGGTCFMTLDAVGTQEYGQGMQSLTAETETWVSAAYATAGGCRACQDGTLAADDPSIANTPQGVNKLAMGHDRADNGQCNGWIMEARYYSTQKDNATQQSITNGNVPETLTLFPVYTPPRRWHYVRM